MPVEKQCENCAFKIGGNCWFIQPVSQAFSKKTSLLNCYFQVLNNYRDTTIDNHRQPYCITIISDTTIDNQSKLVDSPTFNWSIFHFQMLIDVHDQRPRPNRASCVNCRCALLVAARERKTETSWSMLRSSECKPRLIGVKTKNAKNRTTKPIRNRTNNPSETEPKTHQKQHKNLKTQKLKNTKSILPADVSFWPLRRPSLDRKSVV